MVSSRQGWKGNDNRPGRKNSAIEPSGEWKILSPETVVYREWMRINPHPDTLEDKTVILRRNEKPNSETFLNRVAELLSQKVKRVKIIKAWETVPGSDVPNLKPEILRRIAELNPDLVISAQGD